MPRKSDALPSPPLVSLKRLGPELGPEDVDLVQQLLNQFLREAGLSGRLQVVRVDPPTATGATSSRVPSTATGTAASVDPPTATGAATYVDPPTATGATTSRDPFTATGTAASATICDAVKGNGGDASPVDPTTATDATTSVNPPTATGATISGTPCDAVKANGGDALSGGLHVSIERTLPCGARLRLLLSGK